MHLLPLITICGHEWGDLPMEIIAKSHHERPEIVIHGNEGIIDFLHAILCHEYTIPLKT